jgi:DNA-binding HxlR family transcriptional regulator
MRKTYGQYCGLARALDVVGDRWNLLIVRQLLIGPARYGELRDGLPGIATNLLTDRLRDLEENGIVERQLSDDGGAIAYALTAWGSQLREPVDALIRWSLPLMVRGLDGDSFRPDGLYVALPALLAGRTPANQTDRVGIFVDGELVQLSATASGIAVGKPDGQKLDAVLTAEAPYVLGLAAGALLLDDVRALLDIQGNEQALRTILEAPRAREASTIG